MRRLNEDEREVLAPVLDETEITICVKESIEAVEDILWLNGEAEGWLPGRRRITLSERAIERLDDDALLGLAAHELGHHRGRHVFLSHLVRAAAIFGLLGSLLAGFVGMFLTGQLSPLWVSVAGVTISVLFALVGAPAVSRWMELDADRRAVALLGSVEPLVALCEPEVTAPPSGIRERLAELVFPWPHPADRLEALRE